MERSDFRDAKVDDVYELVVREPPVVRKRMRVGDAIDKMLSSPYPNRVYVVDDDGRLVGVITTGAILKLLGFKVGVKGVSALSFYQYMRDTLGDDVESALQRVTGVKRNTRLIEALDIMVKNEWDALPVIDDDGRLVGDLVSVELLYKGRELFK